jgi:hypothetical protein
MARFALVNEISQNRGIRCIPVNFLRIEYLLSFRPFKFHVSFGLLAFEISADRDLPVKAAAITHMAARATGNVDA